MTRRLVITADDLGREAGSALAIAELAADGAITATTAIVVGPAVEEGVAAVTASGLVPHLHATLSSEGGMTPWRPLTTGRSLVTADGTLPDDPVAVGQRAQPADVAAELAAQLAWLHARGIRPAAVDSHSGTLYGLTGCSFLGEALALAARHGMG
ncbi:MAG TPA: ChbG/HpnK family deacetylase, partial [Agromyces sp.]